MNRTTRLSTMSGFVTREKLGLLLVGLIFLALLAAGCSGSPAGRLNQEGNEAFARAAYEEAWAAYQAAQIEDPERAEPYYNAANALYRQGQYAEALEQLQLALSFADQEMLAAQGFFNQGNSAFNTEDLATAIESYRQALMRNPDDMDAKYNLELALQQLEQQQQESQQQENEQEQQDAGEQQEEQRENQSNSPEAEQQSEDSQDQSGEGQDEQNSEEQDQSDNSSGQESDSEDGEESQDEEEPEPGQDGQPDQPQPGESDLTQGDPAQNEEYSVMPEPGQRLSADQARQLLAAIAQNSETLAQRLGQIFAGSNRPPVQDW